MKKSTINIVTYIAMALIFIGVVMVLGDQKTGVYAMMAGAVPFLLVRLMQRYKASVDQKRIYSILVYSALLILVAIVAVYMQKRYWIVPIFIASMVDLYASFRISKS